MNSLNEIQTLTMEPPSDELLLEIDCKGQESEAVMATFYRRYVNLLLESSMGTAEGTNIDGQQLVLDTFKVAFEKAGTFNCCNSDADVIEKKVTGWLFAILRNKYRDAIRKQARETSRRIHLEEDEDIGDKYPDREQVEEDHPKPRPALVERAKELLEELSDRERAILGLSLEYRNPETGRYEIPEDILETLAKTLSVLPTSIKTTRHRILNRIKSILS